MINRFRIIIISLFLSTALFANAEDTYPFTSQADAIRFESITKEVRCVVCQNQSIADSSAPLAKDLRAKIYNMIVENKTDSEINNFLVKRYGPFILLKPSVNKLTLVLWSFPFIGLFITFLFLLRLVKQQSKTRNNKTSK